LLAAFILAAPGAIAQDRHADPQLEALLPTSLGGAILTRESQSGADLTRHSEPFEAFLKGLGKSRADFTVASAYSSGLAAEVGAWRVDGLSAADLLPGFKITLQASSQTPLTVADRSVAGRTVTVIGDAQQLARGPLYVAPHEDALLFVQTNDGKLAEEAIGKLPN